MEKWVACIQSNYVPWKGYFDFINLVDEFILLDNVQYTRRDWRNRNKIKTSKGLQWLTIPVNVKGKYEQLIQNVEINDNTWTDTHLKTIRHNYARTPYFSEVFPLIEEMYKTTSSLRYLSDINYHFLISICNYLSINYKLTWSKDFSYPEAELGPNEHLIFLCKEAGATHYLSGPAAKSYINEELFIRAGIQLVYMDYSDYPEYPQHHPPFEHAVSILDLLLNTGSDATRYMKSFDNNNFRLSLIK